MILFLLTLPFSLSFWYYLISLTTLCILITKVYRIIYELYIMKEKPLLERYGKYSWAIVTGASEGIGWGYSKELALRGFNVL